MDKQTQQKIESSQIVQIDSIHFLSKLNFIKFSLKLILLSLPKFLLLTGRPLTSWADPWCYLNQCYFFNLFCSVDIMQEIKHLVVFIFAKMSINKCLYKTSRWQWCVIFNFFDEALHEMFSVWKKTTLRIKIRTMNSTDCMMLSNMLKFNNYNLKSKCIKYSSIHQKTPNFINIL